KRTDHVLSQPDISCANDTERQHSCDSDWAVLMPAELLLRVSSSSSTIRQGQEHAEPVLFGCRTRPLLRPAISRVITFLGLSDEPRLWQEPRSSARSASWERLNPMASRQFPPPTLISI